eukprot:507447_1
MKRTLDDYKQAESDHTSVSAETCQIERMKLLNGLMIVGEYQQSLEQQYESRVRATETTQPMDTILNLSNGYIPPQKQMTQTKKLHVSQVYNDEEQEEEDQGAADSVDMAWVMQSVIRIKRTMKKITKVELNVSQRVIHEDKVMMNGNKETNGPHHP